MDKPNFLDINTEGAMDILETVSKLSAHSYMWITDLKSGESWCPKNTIEYFGLSTQIYKDFVTVMSELVHPDDRNEFLEGIARRLAGLDITFDLCVRIHDTDDKYSMFNIHTDLIAGEDGTPRYQVAVLKNENVFPEFDPLTDLYSYIRYAGELARVVSTGSKVAVLKIGIEAFNNFHMIYGMDYANELLRQVAMEFIYMMDENSAVYRLDGECFVFMLKNCDRDGLISFEHKLRKKLSDEFFLDGKKIILKISAGAVLLDNYQGEVSSIHSKLSYAFNHSADEHQGQLIIFNDEVCTSSSADLELMKVIHQAVRNGCDGFYLEYQPIVISGSGRIAGAEALVRWRREPYGNVPPGMFIEWMETDPSMYELGNYILLRALKEMRPILELRPDFFVNVNISARQLERPEFRQALLDILDETGFPTGNLCMELTERCRDFPLDALKCEVEYFQSLGIRFAMDDYGTGSASSGIVMNIPMNEIKVDMSFIRGITENPRKQAMVQSIVDFANKSGINTCIEGVENEELQNYLRSFNATWFQGYHYAKPLSPQQLAKLL